MARVRFLTPNFVRIWFTCSFTVPGVTTRALAISWLEAPAANNCSTSSSRPLNGSGKGWATEVWAGIPCAGLGGLEVPFCVGETAIACSSVKGTPFSSTAPNARSEDRCASVKPFTPLISSRS